MSDIIEEALYRHEKIINSQNTCIMILDKQILKSSEKSFTSGRIILKLFCLAMFSLPLYAQDSDSLIWVSGQIYDALYKTPLDSVKVEVMTKDSLVVGCDYSKS